MVKTSKSSMYSNQIISDLEGKNASQFLDKNQKLWL